MKRACLLCGILLFSDTVLFLCKTQVCIFPGTSPVSGLGDRFYTKGGLEFVLRRRVPMPEELSYQIRSRYSVILCCITSPLMLHLQICDRSLAWDYFLRSLEHGLWSTVMYLCGIMKRSEFAIGEEGNGLYCFASFAAMILPISTR